MTSRSPAERTGSRLRLITPWIPYIIAVCLMIIGVGQMKLVLDLQSQLQVARSEATTLRASNALMDLRLIALEAKDPAYLSTKVLVAWDSHMHRGFVSLENLPPPPVAHDYQFWVLDPGAEVPINAGLIDAQGTSHHFAFQSVSTDNPGFAISLEPAGGSSHHTGPILFAIAPAQY